MKIGRLCYLLYIASLNPLRNYKISWWYRKGHRIRWRSCTIQYLYPKPGWPEESQRALQAVNWILLPLVGYEENHRNGRNWPVDIETPHTLIFIALRSFNIREMRGSKFRWKCLKIGDQDFQAFFEYLRHFLKCFFVLLFRSNLIRLFLIVKFKKSLHIRLLSDLCYLIKSSSRTGVLADGINAWSEVYVS
jgi:hypothetical protein